jgi:coenzyme F420-0:L-glutamate ligase/coenzyme F420-1:gamma-L-glutamate ligase
VKRRPPRGRPAHVEVLGLRSLPEIVAGQRLGTLLAAAARREGVGLRRGDVVIIAQKAVSKAEGRVVALAGIVPSPLARAWGRRIRRDPRFVEVVLRESRRVLRMSERALIVETPQGLICANAGVDRSNVASGMVTLLPADADASARRIARQLRSATGFAVPVLVSDTFGRPWRLGLTNVAIGAHGLRVLEDLRGTRDAEGHVLHATILAVADEIAAAAGLVMGKRDRVPAAIVRGYPFRAGPGSGRHILRPEREDLFR